DVNLAAVQLVDHEADDALAMFGDHADAIALPQDAKKLLLAPGILEARVLDRQDLGHVAPDHPPNVHAGLCRGGWNHAHRASFHGTEQTNSNRVPPWNGCEWAILNQRRRRNRRRREVCPGREESEDSCDG